jgi:hypothetical protein
MITKLVTGIYLIICLEEQMKPSRITLKIVGLVDGVIYPSFIVLFFISVLCVHIYIYVQHILAKAATMWVSPQK